MKKLSLILFTIFSQMAVGAFCVLWGLQLNYSSQLETTLLEHITLAPLLIAVATMVMSLLFSLLHLGSPTIAYKAIINLRSSWLSREILFAVLFTGTSVIFAGMQFWQIASFGFRSGVAGLAAFFGLMLIYVMSRLYMIRTVPIWNTGYTLLSFFLTAFILGGLLVAFTIRIYTPGYFIYGLSSALIMVTSISGLVFFLLGSEFVSILAKFVHMVSGSPGMKEAALALFDKYKHVFYLRLVIGALGMGILGFIIFQARYDTGFYYICFTLVLVAELLDRYLFYSARDVSGI